MPEVAAVAASCAVTPVGEPAIAPGMLLDGLEGVVPWLIELWLGSPVVLPVVSVPAVFPVPEVSLGVPGAVVTVPALLSVPEVLPTVSFELGAAVPVGELSVMPVVLVVGAVEVALVSPPTVGAEDVLGTDESEGLVPVGEGVPGQLLLPVVLLVEERSLLLPL